MITSTLMLFTLRFVKAKPQSFLILDQFTVKLPANLVDIDDTNCISMSEPGTMIIPRQLTSNLNMVINYTMTSKLFPTSVLNDNVCITDSNFIKNTGTNGISAVSLTYTYKKAVSLNKFTGLKMFMTTDSKNTQVITVSITNNVNTYTKTYMLRDYVYLGTYGDYVTVLFSDFPNLNTKKISKITFDFSPYMTNADYNFKFVNPALCCNIIDIDTNHNTVNKYNLIDRNRNTYWQLSNTQDNSIQIMMSRKVKRISLSWNISPDSYNLLCVYDDDSSDSLTKTTTYGNVLITPDVHTINVCQPAKRVVKFVVTVPAVNNTVIYDINIA